MARAKSEHKRVALLEAAITIFAERGVWATPTSAISAAAGMAEGTLFTYFTTKDVLLNELYRFLKQEVAERLLLTAPQEPNLRHQAAHVWQHYIRWGVEHPARFRVLQELRLSDRITEESHLVGNEPFAALAALAEGEMRQGTLRQLPAGYLQAAMGGLADATITFITSGHGPLDTVSHTGFALFWSGVEVSGAQ